MKTIELRDVEVSEKVRSAVIGIAGEEDYRRQGYWTPAIRVVKRKDDSSFVADIHGFEGNADRAEVLLMVAMMNRAIELMAEWDAS